VVWLLLLFPAGATAQDRLNIERQAQTRVLANGLTIVVVERPGTASFGGLLGYKAGTVDEPPGGVGTAHLVEHFLAGPAMELADTPAINEAVVNQPEARVREGGEWMIDMQRW